MEEGKVSSSSVGEVVFDINSKCKSNEVEPELTHNEVWDDTLLIQHYDETMQKARNILASKLDSASSVTDSEGSRSHRTEAVNGYSHPKSYSSNNMKRKKKKKGRKKNEWHTGDPCRARYTEDGETYEATILALNNPSGSCTVKYLGYNNYEEVAQSSLLKTMGEGARRKQIKDVNEACSQTDDETEDSYVLESDMPSEEEQEKSRSKHKRACENAMPPPFSAPRMSVPPPPHGQSIPHLPDLPPPPVLGLVDGSDPFSSEVLHTMLMSWYMTGYHTGYYQGLSHGKSINNKSNNNNYHNSNNFKSK